MQMEKKGFMSYLLRFTSTKSFACTRTACDASFNSKDIHKPHKLHAIGPPARKIPIDI